MGPDQKVVATLTAFLLATALVGLFARDKARLCWSFAALLVTALTGNLLTTYTALFYSWPFWALKHAVYGALYLAITLELALLMFAALPRAKAKVLTLVALGILATAGLVYAVADVHHTASETWMVTLTQVQPALRAAAVWLLTFVMLAAIYWHVPLHSFHRAIVVSLDLYLMIFQVFLVWMHRAGWEGLWVLDTFEPFAYMLVVVMWAWAAWRREPASKLSPRVASFLQPWAVR